MSITEPHDDREDSSRMTASEIVRQSNSDRATIKVQLIDNGVLVKDGAGARAFPSWYDASAFIKTRLDELLAARIQEKLRQEAPR